jgi:hypothetical protein
MVLITVDERDNDSTLFELEPTIPENLEKAVKYKNTRFCIKRILKTSSTGQP